MQTAQVPRLRGQCPGRWDSRLHKHSTAPRGTCVGVRRHAERRGKRGFHRDPTFSHLGAGTAGHALASSMSPQVCKTSMWEGKANVGESKDKPGAPDSVAQDLDKLKEAPWGEAEQGRLPADRASPRAATAAWAAPGPSAVRQPPREEERGVPVSERPSRSLCDLGRRVMGNRFCFSYYGCTQITPNLSGSQEQLFAWTSVSRRQGVGKFPAGTAQQGWAGKSWGSKTSHWGSSCQPSCHHALPVWSETGHPDSRCSVRVHLLTAGPRPARGTLLAHVFPPRCPTKGLRWKSAPTWSSSSGSWESTSNGDKCQWTYILSGRLGTRVAGLQVWSQPALLQLFPDH